MPKAAIEQTQEGKVGEEVTPREAEMEQGLSSALAPRFSVSSAANCSRKMRMRRISALGWHSEMAMGALQQSPAGSLLLWECLCRAEGFANIY